MVMDDWYVERMRRGAALKKLRDIAEGKATQASTETDDNVQGSAPNN